MNDEALQKRLGQKARVAREKLKVPQGDVAQQVGLSVAVYGRIERGELMPSVPTVRRIATALGLSLDELLAVETPEHRTSARTPPGGKALTPEVQRLLDAVRKWPPARVEVVTEFLRRLERSFQE